MARGEHSQAVHAGVRWLAAACVVGLVAGLASALLTAACLAAESAHAVMPLAALALPLLGVAGVLVYRALGLPFDVGTLGALDSARADRPAPWKIAPAILMGTALTLLGGGSVGKEAGAMQMGSGIASALHRILGDEARREGSSRILALCGMASAFSALMLTPLAAFAFVLEAVRPKRRDVLDVRLASVVVSSVIGWLVALLLGVGRLWRPESDAPGVLGICPQTLAVSGVCALVGLLFVLALKLVRMGWLRLFANDWIRVAAGGVLVAAVLLIVPGFKVASGTGAALIVSALGGSGVGTYDFACKFALTVLTIGFGLKGGEIMPIMCIGACLGCSLGALLGVSPSFCAAVGLVAMFSACTRCPVAACLMGIEAFGIAGAPVWIAAAFIGLPAAMVSSLYDSSLWHLRSIMSRSSGDRARAVRARGRGHTPHTPSQ